MMNRIYARNCKVCEISKKDANEFIKLYHLQGGVNSQICFGLFYNNELVQVETFGFDRYTHGKYEYELYRECSKKDYYILGGKSKLLKAFIRKYNPHNIISYCSLEEGFDGHSYIDCGFKIIGKSTGSYHYEYMGQRITRQKMQKSAGIESSGKKCHIHATLDSFGLGNIYSPDKTEKEMALEAGFTRVEEKGNLVFEMNLRPFTGIIYKTTNKANNKIYIGQHKTDDDEDNYIGSGIIMLKAIEKYGRNSFVRETLETISETYGDAYIQKINELEIKYIAEYNSTNPEIGYNIDEGGGGHVGYSKTTDEVKQKIGEASKKLWQNPDYRNKVVGAINNAVTPEFRQKMGEATKKRWQNPEYRQKIGEASKQHWQEPEYRQKLSEMHKEYWQNSEHRNKSSESHKKSMTPELKQKMSDASKKLWNDPEYRQRMSNTHKESWKNPEYKQRISEATKKLWQYPDYKQKMSEDSKRRWQDPEYRDKCRVVMTTEVKQKIGEASKRLWQDPEYRQKMGEARLGKHLKIYCYKGKEYKGRQAICDEYNLTIRQINIRIKKGIITVKK